MDIFQKYIPHVEGSLKSRDKEESDDVHDGDTIPVSSDAGNGGDKPGVGESGSGSSNTFDRGRVNIHWNIKNTASDGNKRQDIVPINDGLSQGTPDDGLRKGCATSLNIMEATSGITDDLVKKNEKGTDPQLEIPIIMARLSYTTNGIIDIINREENYTYNPSDERDDMGFLLIRDSVNNLVSIVDQLKSHLIYSIIEHKNKFVDTSTLMQRIDDVISSKREEEEKEESTNDTEHGHENLNSRLKEYDYFIHKLLDSIKTIKDIVMGSNKDEDVFDSVENLKISDNITNNDMNATMEMKASPESSSSSFKINDIKKAAKDLEDVFSKLYDIHIEKIADEKNHAVESYERIENAKRSAIEAKLNDALFQIGRMEEEVKIKEAMIKSMSFKIKELDDKNKELNDENKFMKERISKFEQHSPGPFLTPTTINREGHESSDEGESQQHFSETKIKDMAKLISITRDLNASPLFNQSKGKELFGSSSPQSKKVFVLGNEKNNDELMKTIKESIYENGTTGPFMVVRGVVVFQPNRSLSVTSPSPMGDVTRENIRNEAIKDVVSNSKDNTGDDSNSIETPQLSPISKKGRWTILETPATMEPIKDTPYKAPSVSIMTGTSSSSSNENDKRDGGEMETGAHPLSSPLLYTENVLGTFNIPPKLNLSPEQEVDFADLNPDDDRFFEPQQTVGPDFAEEIGDENERKRKDKEKEEEEEEGEEETEKPKENDNDENSIESLIINPKRNFTVTESSILNDELVVEATKYDRRNNKYEKEDNATPSIVNIRTEKDPMFNISEEVSHAIDIAKARKHSIIIDKKNKGLEKMSIPTAAPKQIKLHIAVNAHNDVQRLNQKKQSSSSQSSLTVPIREFMLKVELQDATSTFKKRDTKNSKKEMPLIIGIAGCLQVKSDENKGWSEFEFAQDFPLTSEAEPGNRKLYFKFMMSPVSTSALTHITINKFSYNITSRIDRNMIYLIGKQRGDDNNYHMVQMSKNTNVIHDDRHEAYKWGKMLVNDLKAPLTTKKNENTAKNYKARIFLKIFCINNGFDSFDGGVSYIRKNANKFNSNERRLSIYSSDAFSDLVSVYYVMTSIEHGFFDVYQSKMVNKSHREEYAFIPSVSILNKNTRTNDIGDRFHYYYNSSIDDIDHNGPDFEDEEEGENMEDESKEFSDDYVEHELGTGDVPTQQETISDDAPTELMGDPWTNLHQEFTIDDDDDDDWGNWE